MPSSSQPPATPPAGAAAPSAASAEPTLPLFALMAAVLVVFATANAPVPIYPIWQHAMGFAPGTIGVIFVFYNLGVLLALLCCGRLSDLYGPRLVLLPALLLAVAAALLFAFAPNVAVLCVARFLIGLASGGCVSAGTAAILLAGRRRGIGHISLYATLSVVLGFGLGPLTAGALASFAPAPSRLVFVLLAGLLAALLLVLARNLPPLRRPSQSARIWQMPRLPAENRPILVTAIVIFAGPFALSALFISLAPSMLADLLHNASPIVAGAAAFLVFASGGLGGVFARKLTVWRSAWLSLALALSSLALVLLSEVSVSLPLFALAAAAAGIAQSVGQYTGVQLVNRHTPEEILGSVNATFFLGGYGTAGLAVLSMGFASNAFGLFAGSLVFGAICLVMFIAAIFGVATTRLVPADGA
ncbi:MFS transporter [Afifella sp. H1R]|uniref:MFS transporter n=1 Tax=Afifella sp. H1R TaxID=2908841 RepID=UPI001F1BD224|nr:MFS transporter [Afifella sp. H1R]MCF1505605.1 MFS transporter [Afifella sp. H1R]